MKVYNILYKDLEQLTSWIKSKNLNKNNECLVSVHSALLQDEECVLLAKGIKNILPYANVNGCSVDSIIYDGDIYDNETLISIREFEFGKVLSRIVSTTDLSSKEIAHSIYEDAKNFPTNFATLFFSYYQKGVFEIIEHLNILLPNVDFTGGFTGKIQKDESVDSFCFDENNFYHNAYLINFISNDYVLNYSDIITGQPPISKIHTITKTHDEYIDEINNIPALQWIEDNLDLKKLTENSTLFDNIDSDILLRFPFVLEGYSSTTRFYRYEQETNQIKLYHFVLEKGQKFRIGYLSSIKSAEELQETCQNLLTTPAEMIFCYSCIFRRLYANNLAKWELSTFKNSGICGAFILGEIGTKNGHTQLLNGSTAFFTLAEKSEHLTPDLTVFERVNSLLEESDDLIKHIINIEKKLQSDIFSSFIAHEEQLRKRFSNSTEKELKSIPQFLKNHAQNKSDQICLISIEQIEKLNLILSDENIEALSEENRKNILNFLDTHYSQYHFNFYSYDNTNFFFTVEEKINNNQFIEIINSLEINCGNNIFHKTKTSFYNNFTFTLVGLSIQQLINANRNNELKIEEKRLYHCDPHDIEENILLTEFEMVAILKDIIKKKTIIPYFQGIYDNKNNCFYMFEALMRLYHPDGKMLFPNDFMDIAKKYGLYLQLSLGMVKSIFELFKDRNEIISINISAQDILSDKFKITVYEYLSNVPNPQNFVFELIETSELDDFEHLLSFIYQVKQLGCKVAIDDFGSNYSNLTKFANLDIDYLKINGSLTKLLGTDLNYNHILESIAFMSEKIQVKLIAQFVETASTQKLLIQNGVHYSQGYFFSKPIPFAELALISNDSCKNYELENDSEEFNEPDYNQEKTKTDTLFLHFGGVLVAIFSILSVIFYVSYNTNEFRKISNRFLIEIATGLSDKISLFTEESKISLQVMGVAMSEYAENYELSYHQELLDLNSATKFNSTYVSYNNSPATDGYGRVLPVPIEDIYGKTIEKEVKMLPIIKDKYGEEILVFSTNLYLKDIKEGEIYGTYKVDDIAKLLVLKSFGGEAFYHIIQTDGTPVYLSERSKDYFSSGNFFTFFKDVENFNGYHIDTIREKMQAKETILLNYTIEGKVRSAVMVPIKNTDWYIISIVLDEINNKMLETNNRSTIIFISFIVALYSLYFGYVHLTFGRHKKIILKTLKESQSLSSSLQLSIEKDSLTGTYSRATAIEKISDMISNQNQKGIIHALAILDIDNFKYVNDTYGHHTGDLYLQSFVSAVKLGIKPGSILGRLGGDEFLLLLNDIESKENIIATFDKIFAHIRKISLGGVDLSCVSVSAGIIIITENQKTYEELMIEADNTLYQAKREGKNKYLFVN